MSYEIEKVTVKELKEDISMGRIFDQALTSIRNEEVVKSKIALIMEIKDLQADTRTKSQAIVNQ